MALYEHVFLSRQDISNQQVDQLVETFRGILENNGGKIVKVENWGLKTLAYRIKKNRKAYYTLLNIDAPSEAVDELERLMRFNEDVLRYMTIRVEEHEDGASAMMQKRDDRPRRGGDRGERGERGDRGDRGPRRDRDDDRPRRPREQDSE
ncbi:30S ribosomal protein S6 [Jiella sp. MQZ9-1]|uniref:Small ribosomal subunit protein bS6 n=1 Tax=Jiella flava TaxID=2816857 RepID=A0A939G2G8_9HYPH|nr:30S ribosomal protein S6 [Jiella flava]MBO0664348.1 30S ribosomal protein S6 [Jiella flava]MCD2472984.1 30S ribosomal protein S6 [Jiella flava]